ncbi:MAG TPA: Smr/MutS family protein, partial [Gemmatimonadaceae bacterium]|nr:Smr/MutS family protein [Gemmatimonadaceae bacterium]
LLVAQGIRVVPFDLELGPGERTLLVSGPNTGGKTVLLKAVGLFTLMAQSGIPVPVAAGTRLAVFDDVFADIGDEQSIEASLSTFSGHVQNLREIVEHATADSLVLIDELGSGTDPSEGAALGGAILEALTRRGTLTLATTHLGSLKLLASELPPVVNASLQFDSERLGPTYEFVKGRPGRSYGLSIARRLLLPEEILSRAEARLSSGERDMAALLEELEGRERGLREREREAGEILEDARARAARIGEREQRVRDRERELQRGGRREARQYLLEARSAVEDTIRKLRSARDDELDGVARAARRGVEERAAAESAAIAALGDGTDAGPPGPSGPVAIGDWVVVDTLGGVRGRVAETRDGELVVTVGAMRMTIPAGAARWAAPEERPDTPVALRGDVPEVAARSEIDVRGMRAAEAESAVMQAVDSAVRADLKALRIIHGKGTGALRERVREMLQKEPRVAAFRIGAWNEGGAGVTVAELS